MKVCMVIGDPIDHSLSPIMHNVGYKALGIEKQFIYKKTKVKIKDLKKFTNSIQESNIRGISLTMPHKIEIMQYLDNIDKVANKIGAVNTIVNDNGALKGYNTDWLGVITPLQKITSLNKKRVALIGAGGAARAVVYGCMKKGAKVTIFNRTIEKGKQISDDFGCSYKSLELLSDLKDYDIIFNATSVGMKPNKDTSPILKEYINPHHIVFDAIYSPHETQLIKDAKDKGAKVIYGIEMLLYQGTAQFELFTNQKAPVDKMREALERTIND